MSGRVEHADGERNAAFPESWGEPRGAPSSEERATWVMNHVRQLVVIRKATPEDLRRDLARKRVAPWSR